MFCRHFSVGGILSEKLLLQHSLSHGLDLANVQVLMKDISIGMEGALEV